MENPVTWNNAQHIINEAIEEHRQAVRSGLSGLSLVSTIYNRLLEKGLINLSQIKNP